MKVLLKKVILTIIVICILVPSLLYGFVLAADVPLTQERAGNYVANFAINFFENWSSIRVEEGEYSSKISFKGEFGWPLKDTDVTITSNFEDTEAIRNGTAHNGMDIAPYGDINRTIEVFAVSNGTIVDAACDIPDGNDGHGGMGNYVVIQNGDLRIRYLHLKKVSDAILSAIGSEISAGTCIGEMGNTGNSTGKHLHIDFSVENEDLAKSFDTTYFFHNSVYFVNPAKFISPDNVKLSTSPSTITRGSIETQYDEQATVDDIDEQQTPYTFSNKSWIAFVYKWALQMDSDVMINTDVNTSYFDSEEKIFGSIMVKNEDVINISELITKGKLLPGDVLYITNGEGNGEYVLYVGGTKIIYATPMFIKNNEESEENTDGSGALKYEYLQYYLDRIKSNLKEKHKDDKNYILPKYGVTKVYRINSETANSKTEVNTNLFFNGKGYYSYTEYNGAPKLKEIDYLGTSNVGILRWIFSTIKQILNFIINLITYIVRMQILGWTNIIESILNNTILGISGHNENGGVDAFFGTNGTSISGDRLTVESIFFNQVPIFDANFFNFETAGGRSLKIEAAGPKNKDGEKIEAIDTDNIVYKLKQNLATWYVIIRNLSIAILLFILIYLGIKLAITSSTQKKAECKKLLVSWATAMCIVFFIHFFMYLVFEINDILVGICMDIGSNATNAQLEELIDQTGNQNEMNLYDAVRTKAYVFNWREGVPATIIYIFLIYLLIRFSIIYLKRYLTIYILALSGSFMGVKFALEKIAGKKTTSLNKWLKDFAFNVLLQTVHAFLYVIFLIIALSVSQKSLVGAGLALIILNFMLKADKIIIKIFALDKAGSLADVNNPEKWTDLIHEYMPIITISKNAFNFAGKFFIGDRGIFSEIRYMTTGKNNIRDAKKELEKRKYERIGNRWRSIEEKMQKFSKTRLGKRISKVPIKNLSTYAKYKRLLGNNLSADTNKRLLALIKENKKSRRAKFTRKISTIKDFSAGFAGNLAAIGVGIADPIAGFTIYTKTKQNINKYRETNRIKLKSSKYTASTAKAKGNMNKAKQNYNNALDEYANNEYIYQQQREKLSDDYLMATTSAEKGAIRAQIDSLDENRKIKKSQELHKVQTTYEDYAESKVLYGNAKHEKGLSNKALNTVGKATGISVVGDFAQNYVKGTYDDSEKVSKQKSKLDDLAKVAKFEQELRELNKQLKVERKKYADVNERVNGISQEESNKKLDKQLSDTIKEAKKMNVRVSYIKEAVSSYLFENSIDRITGENVDDVLNKLQKMLSESGKKIKFTNDVKQKVKKELEEKMLKDSKGLGLDVKDATTTIRSTLGKNGVLKPSKSQTVHDINNTSQELKNIEDNIGSIHEKILQKIKDINTYDEVGKVKYKESLVSINKIIKDAKKQGK